MHIFKTSAETFDSVIKNKKHAFHGKPKDLVKGDLILISKNKSGLKNNEKQISYTMVFSNIREIKPNEAEELWPGNEGRWSYIVECSDVIKLKNPFNLEDHIGHERAEKYGPIITHGKIKDKDEELIIQKIKNIGVASPDIEKTSPTININSSKPHSYVNYWVVIPLVIIAFITGALLF